MRPRPDGGTGLQTLYRRTSMNAVVLVAILGLALLMIVHEAGHLLAARAFGMRVVRFSIGFGPALWKLPSPRQRDGLPSRADPVPGLRPNRRHEPVRGRRSGRQVELRECLARSAASRPSSPGPLANYLFASVLFFAALVIGGNRVPDHLRGRAGRARKSRTHGSAATLFSTSTASPSPIGIRCAS